MYVHYNWPSIRLCCHCLYITIVYVGIELLFRREIKTTCMYTPISAMLVDSYRIYCAATTRGISLICQIYFNKSPVGGRNVR
jgi:hypothetical protein